MSTGAFSLDQLMELAGLSVSQAGAFGLSHVCKHPMTAGSIPFTAFK